MKLLFVTAAASVLLLGGCAQNPYPSLPEMAAAYTADPVLMDGKLDEKAWKQATVYELATAREAWNNRHPELRAVYGAKPVSPGKVRLLWDKEYLYIGAEFQDDDIVAEGTKDQQMHCNLGDVLEVFLKPAEANHYWEIHISPANYQIVLFYPGRGHHLLPSVIPDKKPLGVKSAITLDGTLNRSDDFDRAWTAEVAIPLAEPGLKGVPLDSKNNWKILIGRYNYSCHQKVKELSSFPELRFFDFHSHEEYATLKLKE